MTSPWTYFSTVWIVIANVQRKAGEQHAPLAMVGVELASGRLIEIGVPKLFSIRRPPYPTGPQTLIVCIDADQLSACHLALGWRLPDRIVDLMIEFRSITNGIRNGLFGGLCGALIWFGKRTAGAFATGSSPSEMRARLAAIVELYHAIQPRLDLGRAILRGRFTRAVASIEAAGVPIDRHALVALREHWRAVREMAWASPHVRAVEAPRAILVGFDPSLLSVGRDGRNRVSLRPFSSVTGRNQPSVRRSVLYSAAWLRHLILPEPGTGLALIDWQQQEFGIAAALSGDPDMQAAYLSGDPYLALAIKAGAAPPGAVAAGNKSIRERFKGAVLGVQYGMGAQRLGLQLGITKAEADDILQAHRSAFPRFWSWSDNVETSALLRREMLSVFGWRLAVEPPANPRSLRNFPMQANGAEMLRLAACLATEQGIRVCGLIHDALLIQAPLAQLEEAIAKTQGLMAEASAVVLDGFALRTDVRAVRAPDRWTDSRGSAVWVAVSEAIQCLNGPVHERCTTCSPARARSISLSVL